MAEAEVDSDWSTSANEALVVSLVMPTAGGASKTIASFNPKFTYPIFGDDEQIFGYQGLKISLRFNATDMRPHLKVSSSKRFQAVGDTERADINEILKHFLPQVAFAKNLDFEEAIKQVPRDWKPPGTCISTTATKDGQYEVWQGSLGDPAVQQLMKRIQILVPLFIEGGTAIALEATDNEELDSLDRWTVFFMYQKQTASAHTDRSPYVFAGYSTVYRFYHFSPLTPPASPDQSARDVELPKVPMPFSEFSCRSRISQFIILEPFQHKGNGARLYTAIFQTLVKDQKIYEITVEDPNEAFDDMRDLSDLTLLRQQPDFNELQINASITIGKTGPLPRDIIDQQRFEKLRLKYKIAPRQFKRVVEMHLMSKLSDSVRVVLEVPSETKPQSESKKAATKEQEHEYDLWKLLVKARLLAQHRDVLAQIDPPERIVKLQETFENVEIEYARLLTFFEVRKKKAEATANGKRKLEGDAEKHSNSKKARVQDS